MEEKSYIESFAEWQGAYKDLHKGLEFLGFLNDGPRQNPAPQETYEQLMKDKEREAELWRAFSERWLK